MSAVALLVAADKQIVIEQLAALQTTHTPITIIAEVQAPLNLEPYSHRAAVAVMFVYYCACRLVLQRPYKHSSKQPTTTAFPK